MYKNRKKYKRNMIVPHPPRGSVLPAQFITTISLSHFIYKLHQAAVKQEQTSVAVLQLLSLALVTTVLIIVLPLPGKY